MTETMRTVRDGEPRTATSTFTQLLSSESVKSVLYLYSTSRPMKIDILLALPCKKTEKSNVYYAYAHI